MSHRAVNRLVMKTDYVEVSPPEVIAQASNISFDAATFEIWGALLNGARMVLIAKGTLLSPQSLAAAIERHGITTLFLTTALFNQMVEQIPAALGKLRYLLFGGEAVDPREGQRAVTQRPAESLTPCLRSYRNDDVCNVLLGKSCCGGCHDGSHRPADCEHGNLHSRCKFKPCTDWRLWRAIHWRPRPSARVSEPSGTNSGEVY